jgi:inosine/xanthosine triphosphatase
VVEWELPKLQIRACCELLFSIIFQYESSGFCKCAAPAFPKCDRVFLRRSHGSLFIAPSAQYNSVKRPQSMNKLTIVVGSTRKPKINAVRDAVDGMRVLLPSAMDIEIVGVEVESGVSHTPLSREESMRGARQRTGSLCKIAKDEGKRWDYFVGLEGGLDSVVENGERRVFLESWAYVSDGTRGHFGRSGAVELPGALAEEVFVRGTELSVAIDKFAGEAGIRDAQGAWGVLSANRITRQDAFRIALIAAFAPFFNEKAYGTTTTLKQTG